VHDRVGKTGASSIYQTFNTFLREAKKLVYTRVGAKGEKLRDRMLIRPFLIS
jgi:hypothetical protein